MAAFCCVTTVYAEDFTFQWVGSPPQDLVVKYRIYWRSDDTWYNAEDMEEIPIENLSDPENPEWTLRIYPAINSDELYFAATAVDNYGSESDYSNEVSSLSGNMSGSGPESGNDGGECFIATAAYGSYMEAHVMILRKFRDRFMLTHPAGRTLIRLYYTCSPPFAYFIAEHQALRAVTRWVLLPLVGVSWVTLQLDPFKFLVLMILFSSVCGMIGTVLKRGLIRGRSCETFLHLHVN